MASDLPVNLLEEIFLRLDDTADLARASAACASFRRVVSDGRFLRRFRSVHRRPILGLLHDERHGHCETGLFCPAQPPWRSAQAAAGLAKAADFTFPFLPDRSEWRADDVRDGRVLLTWNPNPHYMPEGLVVYDPLHRWYVQVPTIPDDLLLSAMQDGNSEAMALGDPFLAPAVDEDERDDDDESSLRFQVMCTGLSKTEVVAFVFSSASGQWRRGASFSNRSHEWTNLPWLWSRQYVHGHGCSVCLTHQAANVMLVFDTREMKFSITHLPRKCIGNFWMAVDAGDGRLGVLILSNLWTTMHLYSKAWQDIQEPQEWRHDSSIPMPGFHLSFAGAAEGYALLRGIPQDQNDPWFPICSKKTREAHYFTLEFKTLLVERLCVMKFDSEPKFLYASFPPPFCPPSV